MLDHPGPLVRAAPSTASLLGAFRSGALSPVEAAEAALGRIRDCDETLGAMLVLTEDLAMAQARAAETGWRDGRAGPLAGVPVSIKDTFDVAGLVTTRGSRVFTQNLAFEDSGVVRRLRAAGAVFVGKTNTAEFGQSATSENRLGPVTRNPWNTAATPGGSSGGAAVSVAAGYVPLVLGADGGGSIRIPAAMTGVFGFKPSYGLCADEGGFRGMSDFCCAGPLSHDVADARLFLSVLAERDFNTRGAGRSRRIGFCAAPDGLPVDPVIRAAMARAAALLEGLGHAVEDIRLDLKGWDAAFGPLVLAEEWRERGHLLPTTATAAFPIGQRPREIDGQRIGRLWGPYPFTSPFNVAGTPAAALPCGVGDGLPLSVQLVAGFGQDAALLDLAQELEEALDFRACHIDRAARND